jgi:hypothetical protein
MKIHLGYATPSITNWWQWWDVISQNEVQDTDQMYYKKYFLNHGFGRYTLHGIIINHNFKAILIYKGT